jgi:hypothetical protein
MADNAVKSVTIDEVIAGEEPATPQPKYDRSIIEGSLPRAVWKIAWPTMLGSRG